MSSLINSIMKYKIIDGGAVSEQPEIISNVNCSSPNNIYIIYSNTITEYNRDTTSFDLVDPMDNLQLLQENIFKKNILNLVDHPSTQNNIISSIYIHILVSSGIFILCKPIGDKYQNTYPNLKYLVFSKQKRNIWIIQKKDIFTYPKINLVLDNIINTTECHLDLVYSGIFCMFKTLDNYFFNSDLIKKAHIMKPIKPVEDTTHPLYIEYDIINIGIENILNENLSFELPIYLFFKGFFTYKPDIQVLNMSSIIAMDKYDYSDIVQIFRLCKGFQDLSDIIQIYNKLLEIYVNDQNTNASPNYHILDDDITGEILSLLVFHISKEKGESKFRIKKTIGGRFFYKNKLEIGGDLVMPEYRKLGFYKNITKIFIDVVRCIYPTDIIYLFTKHKYVIKTHLDSGLIMLDAQYTDTFTSIHTKKIYRNLHGYHYVFRTPGTLGHNILDNCLSEGITCQSIYIGDGLFMTARHCCCDDEYAKETGTKKWSNDQNYRFLKNDQTNIKLKQQIHRTWPEIEDLEAYLDVNFAIVSDNNDKTKLDTYIKKFQIEKVMIYENPETLSTEMRPTSSYIHLYTSKMIRDEWFNSDSPIIFKEINYSRKEIINDESTFFNLRFNEQLKMLRNESYYKVEGSKYKLQILNTGLKDKDTNDIFKLLTTNYIDRYFKNNDVMRYIKKNNKFSNISDTFYDKLVTFNEIDMKSILIKIIEYCDSQSSHETNPVPVKYSLFNLTSDDGHKNIISLWNNEIKKSLNQHNNQLKEYNVNNKTDLEGNIIRFIDELLAIKSLDYNLEIKNLIKHLYMTKFVYLSDINKDQLYEINRTWFDYLMMDYTISSKKPGGIIESKIFDQELNDYNNNNISYKNHVDTGDQYKSMTQQDFVGQDDKIQGNSGGTFYTEIENRPFYIGPVGTNDYGHGQSATTQNAKIVSSHANTLIQLIPSKFETLINDLESFLVKYQQIYPSKMPKIYTYRSYNTTLELGAVQLGGGHIYNYLSKVSEHTFKKYKYFSQNDFIYINDDHHSQIQRDLNIKDQKTKLINHYKVSDFELQKIKKLIEDT